MPKRSRNRDPVKNRQAILEAAFTTARKHGFLNLRLDDVLKEVGLTKGALYHHFRNKEALGCAMIDECVGPAIEAKWILPVEQSKAPLASLAKLLDRWSRETKKESLQNEGIFTRLMDELGTEEDSYADRLSKIQNEWRQRWIEAISAEASLKERKPPLSPEDFVVLAIAAIQGLEVAARTAPTKAFWKGGVDALSRWVKSQDSAVRDSKGKQHKDSVLKDLEQSVVQVMQVGSDAVDSYEAHKAVTQDEDSSDRHSVTDLCTEKDVGSKDAESDSSGPSRDGKRSSATDEKDEVVIFRVGEDPDQERAQKPNQLNTSSESKKEAGRSMDTNSGHQTEAAEANESFIVSKEENVPDGGYSEV